MIFKTLDTRQHRSVIPKRGETSKMSPAQYLKSVSRPYVIQVEPGSPYVEEILQRSQGDKEARVTEQSAREETAA